MQTELAKLQGTWNITSLEVGGMRLASGSFAGSITIKESRFTSNNMGATYSGTIELDPAASPKILGLKFTTGPEKGNSNFGIYELLDEDHWRLCLSMTGGPAPSTFATSPKDGFALETLERQSTQPPEVEPPSTGTTSELEGEWEMVSGIKDGHALDKRMRKSARRSVHGDQMSMHFGSQLFLKSRFTLDPNQQPKTIDLIPLQGDSTGSLQRGIYELEGSTWKICYAPAGERRPADFESTPGDGRVSAVWTRTSR